MTSLLESYEQQYAVVTAELTSKIAKLPNLPHSDRRALSTELEKQLDELQELLEQMELEARDVEPQLRAKYKMRVESYRTELSRLDAEFKSKTTAGIISDGESSDVFGEVYLKDEQRQRLLDTSERIERSGNLLTAGYRVLLETEGMGNQVLRDLHTQRETIQRARARVRETDADLGLSSRIANSLLVKYVQERLALVAVGLIFLLVIGFTLYYVITRPPS